MSVRNVVCFHEAEGPPFAALACKAEKAVLGRLLADFLARVRVTRGARIMPVPREDGLTRVNGMGRLAAWVVVHLVQAGWRVVSVALVDPATGDHDDTADYRYRIRPEREPTGPDPDGEARLMLHVENIDNGGAWTGFAEDWP